MRKTDNLKEIQGLELSILDYITDICKENDLRYFLAGGTLLGAVRHNGFIPWDNDVDISMPRPDYNRLIAIMEKQPVGRYQILSPKNKNDYYYPFAKVVDTKTKLVELTRSNSVSNMGLFIDIFPIDTVPADHNIAVERLRYVNKWGIKIAGSVASDKDLPAFRKVTHFIWYWLFKGLGREQCLEKVEAKLAYDQFGSTGYIASTYGLREEKEIIEYEAFASAVELPFEGKTYSCPIGYDKYLRQMYGDYMKLPPEKDRVAPHDVEVYIDC